ncbi:hypothetical protein Q8A67_018389 [Cirrhinus molitorella]|uniref:Uncharacterized protein n=1 Tax=Cirrhinus molitorella TaxID=172907 RepID=A0AA88PG54_9TELE|nr:hypothetical protein Q8A67_018389 [Cirrhinus molitorella]
MMKHFSEKSGGRKSGQLHSNCNHNGSLPPEQRAPYASQELRPIAPALSSRAGILLPSHLAPSAQIPGVPLPKLGILQPVLRQDRVT